VQARIAEYRRVQCLTASPPLNLSGIILYRRVVAHLGPKLGPAASQKRVCHMVKQTKEFRGKSESDIEAQFMTWRRRTAGTVHDVKRGLIERLPLDMRTPGNHVSLEAENPFSMLVEYELMGPIDHDEPKPKFRKLKPSSGGSRTASAAQKKPKPRGLRSGRRVGANPIKRKKRPHKRGRRS
jgi:hypothetical protein